MSTTSFVLSLVVFICNSCPPPPPPPPLPHIIYPFSFPLTFLLSFFSVSPPLLLIHPLLLRLLILPSSSIFFSPPPLLLPSLTFNSSLQISLLLLFLLFLLLLSYSLSSLECCYSLPILPPISHLLLLIPSYSYSINKADYFLYTHSLLLLCSSFLSLSTKSLLLSYKTISFPFPQTLLSSSSSSSYQQRTSCRFL